MYKVHVVENGVQAKEVIDQLQGEGFSRDEVYIFAHDKDTSKDLTDATHSGEVGVKEQGSWIAWEMFSKSVEMNYAQKCKI